MKLIYISILQVFIPINIRELHWYLVVLNAKRREIQILDSLGSSLGHKDLDCVVSK
jgi:Ulp1 family protease